MYMMRNLGSERLYLCNFCDVSSVEKDLIEAHVQILPDLTNRAMTGYKDYYFCDQCFKKFDTETDMLHHKWTHFLKLSDNSQTQPKSVLVDRNESKVTYNCEQVPEAMKPKVVLERISVEEKVLNENVDVVDVKSFNDKNGEINKPIVDPKSKKTIISRHQCQTCGKYYSSSFCLMRHIDTQHSDYENLHCNVCEEHFAWPSLLKNHKCVHIRPEETHFSDSRPEIHFDNLYEISHNGFDDFNLPDSDYINSVDFEIPAPVVELPEHGGFCQNFNYNNDVSVNSNKGSLGNGYKLIMQEVPIEF
ncbi:hypothetical protein K1T71_015211 [Dendrolimus kikuchii]|nr:hypothetical protein K1T71_015211 [Dendrolimus kikuchii]